MIIKKLYRLLYQKYKLRKTGKVGKNVRIIPKIAIMNPECIEIGNDCHFGPNCKIEAWKQYGTDHFDPRIKIGDRVNITSECHIGAIEKIVIGDDCLLGSRVMIVDHNHGQTTLTDLCIPPIERKLVSRGEVIIGTRTWIGENVCILSGVTIGEGSVIGANAVVTKSVPPYSLVVGCPARVVKRVEVV